MFLEKYFSKNINLKFCWWWLAGVDFAISKEETVFFSDQACLAIYDMITNVYSLCSVFTGLTPCDNVIKKDFEDITYTQKPVKYFKK